MGGLLFEEGRLLMNLTSRGATIRGGALIRGGATIREDTVTYLFGDQLMCIHSVTVDHK